MPRTASDLWERVVSWDNLVEAYVAARRHKRYKPDVLEFHDRWEERLLNIHNHLVWGSWRPQPFAEFPVFEPKFRMIEAPKFGDRIVHHAIHRVVEPYFERRFICHSYACRKGKGTHAASAAVQKMLRRCQKRWGRVYVLQADISRYFPSIRHDRLIRQIRRIIGDKRVVSLWSRIIRDRGENGVGIPIGALTSQLAANVYLDALDHHVIDDTGLGYYIRYMDDFLVFGRDKASLWRLLGHLRQWLLDDLGLTLSRAHVYPARKGINFAGYRIWTTHRKPRKANTKRARRRIKGLAVLCARGEDKKEALQSVKASFHGYTKFCSAATVWQEMEKDLQNIGGPESISSSPDSTDL